MNDKFCDLVCEGGGIKGIALLGAIYYLNEQGYEFKKIAGTSAGAIVASLLAVGYKGNELKDILFNIDFKKSILYLPKSLCFLLSYSW